MNEKAYGRYAKIVGRRVRQLRRERGWIQADLVAHIDEVVGRTAISLYETGKALPSLAVLIRLAEALDVPPQLLLLDPTIDPRHKVAAGAFLASKAVVKRLAAVLDKPDHA